jgi:hypothetical protein
LHGAVSRYRCEVAVHIASSMVRGIRQSRLELPGHSDEP